MNLSTSPALNSLSFQLSRQYGDDGDPIVVMPVIDGRCLERMISDFELRQAFDDPAGGYGGLIPSAFDFGSLDRYFLGMSVRPNPARIFVLGCECGEVGCWPLECEIKIDEDFVIWRNFRQPYRTERDYAPFGPFVFPLRHYQDEVEELVRAMKGSDG
jgi:hypothetical protein